MNQLTDSSNEVLQRATLYNRTIMSDNNKPDPFKDRNCIEISYKLLPLTGTFPVNSGSVWKPDSERGAFVRFGSDLDFTIMVLNDVIADGKAKS